MINLQFLQTISSFEIMQTGLFLFLSTASLALFSIYMTDDRKTGVVVLISLIKNVALTTIALYLIFISGRIVLNNRYYFVLWLPYSINFFNLLMLTFEYNRLRKEKGFDIDFVSRHHFNQSLQIGLIISLLSLVVFAFIPRELSFIIAIISLLCILSLSFTHFVVRKFLKEK